MRSDSFEWHSITHRDLPIELLEAAMPLPRTVLDSPGFADVVTVGELLERVRLLPTDPNDEMESFERWLKHESNLPLAMYLSPATSAAAMEQARLRPRDPGVAEVMLLLDTAIIEVLWQHRQPLKVIDRALREWCATDGTPAMSDGLWAEASTVLLPKPRGIAIIGTYFGITGAEPTTLEAIGNDMGITRERVRQLKGRALPQGSEAQRWRLLPSAIAALQVLADSPVPLTLAEWHRRLPEELWRRPESELRVLPALNGWVGGYRVFTTKQLGLEWFHTTEEGIARLDEELGWIVRSLRGMAKRLAVPPDLEIDDPWQFAVAEQYLSSGVDGWQRLREGWWTRAASDGWQPCRLVAQILGGLGPTSVEHLRRGLGRVKLSGLKSGRVSLKVPPRKALREILKRSGFSVDSNDIVALGDRKAEPLPESQKLLLKVFRKQGPLMSWAGTLELLRKRGMKLVTATLLIGASPLIRRVGRGLYVLNGADVDSEEIAEFERRLDDQARTRLLGSKLQVPGHVVIRYRVSAKDRPWRYPTGKQSPSEGDWEFDIGASRARVTVRDGWIMGLRRLESRAHKAGAVAMEVHFLEGLRLVKLAMIDSKGAMRPWLPAE